MSKAFTTEQFIEKAKLKHRDKYDYSKAIYENSDSQIIIICPLHGEFEQLAERHLMGQGCKKCGHLKRKETLLKEGTNKFIEKSRLKFGDLFNYSNTEFKGCFEKITVTCKEHGDFSINIQYHLAKKSYGGCPICKPKRGEWWTKTAWKEQCVGKIVKLYVLRCWNEEEEFFKVGITSKEGVNYRFHGKDAMPYEYETIKLITSEDAIYIYNLEVRLHRILKKYRYLPKIRFGGYTECFSIFSPSLIENEINDLEYEMTQLEEDFD